MLKKAFVFFLSIILIASFANISLAKDEIRELPQVDGIYDVPGNPRLKLKVIVHKERSENAAKPSPTPPASCSVSDPDSAAEVGTGGWYLPPNWTYSLNVDSAPSAIRSNLPQIAQNSFMVWSQGTGGLVNFTKTADTAVAKPSFDGIHIIAWSRLSRSVLGITYTWFETATGLVGENDTIMNSGLSWSWTPYALDACVSPRTYDVQNILTHEIGHWMGLGDEYTSSFVDNTMYGYGGKAEIKKDTLTTGDIIGLQKIYY